MRLTCILLTVLLAACGGDDDAAEVQAAVETARKRYEAREANIAAAIRQAGEAGDVPPLDWGDRPAGEFPDMRYDKFGRGKNGRMFEVVGGSLNMDSSTLLGLFVDNAWGRDIVDALDKPNNKHHVESAIARYLEIRFLCLLLTDTFTPPDAGATTAFKVDYKPGNWKGRALYFDLEQGKLIGGKTIYIRNPERLDFKTVAKSADEMRKAAETAALEDLRKQIHEAAAKP